MNGKKISTFRERFTELVESSGKSQTSIASEFKVSKQTISAWITGQTSPRAPALTALADYFDVSVAWLMGFDVPKRSEKRVESFVPSLTPDESLLIEGYRALPDQGKQYMLQQLTAANAIYGGKDRSSDASDVG